MQGDAVRSLRIIAERKGWDPSKLDGKPIEVGLTIRKPDGTGDVSLSPFPGPPADSNPDNPVKSETVDWEHPTDTSMTNRHGGGASPYEGKPGAA